MDLRWDLLICNKAEPKNSNQVKHYVSLKDKEY